MKNLTREQTQNLANVFSAINDFIAGKFVLSDIRLSKLVNAVNNCKHVYDLILQCSKHFDFDAELQSASVHNKINGGFFRLPSDSDKVIALTYGLLLAVYSGKINLQSFATENFYNRKGQNEVFSNFALVMILPFKTEILKRLQCKEDGTHFVYEFASVVTPSKSKAEQVSVDDLMDSSEKEKVKQGFLRLKEELTVLVSVVKQTKKLNIDKKEEVVIVANAMLAAIRQHDIKTVSALSIALNYILHKNRALAPYFYNFVERLSELL